MSDSVTPWTVGHQTPLSVGILQAGILEWVAMPSWGIFPTQESNPGLPHCWRILYHLSHQGNPSSADLPDPEIKPGSPALQEDSLPTEPQGKPYMLAVQIF